LRREDLDLGAFVLKTTRFFEKTKKILPNFNRLIWTDYTEIRLIL